MKEFWNERYREPGYVYGEAPNTFFKTSIDALLPGRILLPADGEGRNGVYAALKGWEVTSFDYSISAREKAMELASRQGVQLHYLVGAFGDMEFPPGTFDAIALIFAHFPPGEREEYHRKVIHWLRPGGQVILEAFTPDHLSFQQQNPRAGGPRSRQLLYDPGTLQVDFAGLDIQLIEEQVIYLEEGLYHVGESAVVRMVAVKR